MAKSKRPEPNLSLEEVRQALAIGLRDKVAAVAEKFKDLKTREIGRKLGKHELCPLCGNADIPGSCVCVRLSKSEGTFKIQKNAVMGYDGGDSMAMSEEDMAKGELCKNCGKAHTADGSYDHDLEKALIAGAPATPGQTMPPVKKDEMNPKAVLPGDKKVKEPDETGSGGEIKKLAKGFGGAAAAAHPHPDTMASLKDIASLAPKAQPRQSLAHLSPVVRANAQMSKFKSIAHNPLAMPGNTPLVNPKAMTGHGVAGTINAKPAAPAVSKPAPAQAKVQVQADTKAQDAANLAADKKAGGVGWLNSLISRFKKPVAAPIGSGPVRSQASPYAGIRGAAALARSENYENDLIKSLGDCALCKKPEHLGNC